jgi:hypothetical protein
VKPRAVLAHATLADFAELAARSPHTPAQPPVRVMAIAGKVDGRVIAIGGIAFMPNGQRVAFTDITDEARKYPVTMHKAGLIMLALAKKHGIQRLVARGESHEASERWLLRLGFCKQIVGEATNYVIDL